MMMHGIKTLNNYFSPDCLVLIKLYFKIILPSTAGVLNVLFLSKDFPFSFHCLAQRQQHCLEFVSESASLVFFSRIHGPNQFFGYYKLTEQY